LRLFASKGYFSAVNSNPYSVRLPATLHRPIVPRALWKSGLILIFSLAALPLPAREKDALQYGAGLIVNLPFPENEVALVVRDVVQNGIIRGTKEYNKDEYVSGAAPANSTHVFPEHMAAGQVYYKVRLKAIDPRNFKDGGDVGTLAVRYILQPQGANNTVLHIDARFVEDFRKTSHPSNGSVESAEYKDIHDRLDAVASMRAQTVEAEKEKQEQLARKQNPDRSGESPVSSSSASSNSEPANPVSASQAAENQAAPNQVSSNRVSSNQPASEPASSNQVQSESAVPTSAQSTPSNSAPAGATESAASANGGAPVPQPAVGQTLEEHVRDLKQQVERLVKAPGAPLKSAPFHTASTLQTLPAGTEVLIVVSTPYWLGVETHEGQHGWILRDQLEQPQ
jgi:hypothetical protein